MLNSAVMKRTWVEATKRHFEEPEADQFNLDLSGAHVSRETEPGLNISLLGDELMSKVPDKAFFDVMEFYARLTLEANQKLNLVSRRSPEKQILANIMESLPLAYVWLHISRETDDSEKLNFMMDVGTGSGVPGIPAWILLDHLSEEEAPESLILIESRGRKAEFLEYALDEMSLECASVFSHRLESPDLPLVLEVNQVKGPGMLCTRALTSVDQTLKWSKNLKDKVREMVLIKGTKGLSQEWREERGRWPKKGWNLEDTLALDFPDRRTLFAWLRQV
ncbi:MAG: hypothetical protein GY835_26790 [bacterium]|nr:hypothetical protein [bacterium]